MTYTIQAEYAYAALMPKEHMTFLFDTEEHFSSRAFTRSLRKAFRNNYGDFYKRANGIVTVDVFKQGNEEPVRHLGFTY